MNQNTYILRMNPGKINKIEENRNENRISIGWSSIGIDLLDANLFRYEFREKIHTHFQYPNYRASGNAAGSLWNFIREMKIGDCVLIPTPGGVYVTVLEGNVEFLRDKIDSETAISRKAKWLNSIPYPRTSILGLLNSRLKVRQTCIQINDLKREVEDLMDHLNSNDPPTFKETLKEKLVTNCLKELREGRLENFGFENLIHKYLLGIGAKEAEIIPRSLDIGVDIVASFQFAKYFETKVAVQAKHWQPGNSVHVTEINHFIKGMEKYEIYEGMFITSGEFHNDCLPLIDDCADKKGINIQLIDGETFASLLIDNGLDIL